MAPTAVNWVYITSPIAMAFGARWASELAARRGRPRVCMCFGLGGAFFMCVLGVLGTVFPGLDRTSTEGRAVYVCVYFLTCLQHCCRPIKKSILMDFSKKKSRGGWNAVDSITRFGWSGSAVLGGVLVDAFSYEACFVATSVFLTAAALLWPLLFDYVP